MKLQLLYSTFSSVLVSGPFTSLFAWIQKEGQAAASAIIVGVGIYLLVKRETSKFLSFILLGGGALLFVFSPSIMVTWLGNLFKSVLGIS